MAAMLGAALVSFLPTSKPTENHRHLLNRVGAHRSQSRAAQIVHPAACSNPRCSIVAFDDGAGMNGASALEDKQIVAIFEEFDTSGDGFIDLGELEAALSRAGKRVSREEAQRILDRVDVNKDGQISLDEFRLVFSLEPSAVPDSLRALTSVSSFFLDSLGRVGEALGIEVTGQWRTTDSGCRYVDDVLGSGALLEPGDIVEIHYSVTLLSSDKVVDTSRGGPPFGFQLVDVSKVAGAVQGWNDAVVGMRVGGQRRVYAKPAEGAEEEGPAARYDIEVVGVQEGVPRSAAENVITALGGRRAAFRLLFAASFVPYFFPNEKRPAFFQDGWGEKDAAEDKPKVDKSDAYIAKQLDALFAGEEREGSRK